MRTPYKEAKLTADQKYRLEVAHVAFMEAAPFYADLSYNLCKEFYTTEIPTLQTDGRRILINPEYFCKLKPGEQVFALAHEMSHVVCSHPTRMRNYAKEGSIRGKPVIPFLVNICADYVINADLIESKIGQCNPDWIYDPAIKGSELWEDVYERIFPPPPPKPPVGGSGTGKQPGQPGDQPGAGGGQSNDGNNPQTPQHTTKKRRDAPGSVRGALGDPVAAANGGAFDEVVEPAPDDEMPDENEFREAVARAVATAKAIGKELSPGMKRMVDEILDPQVDWRDHIRLLMTGKIGQRGETWARPNRRRLALNPIVIMPGKRGYGCELVVVGADTSGSVGPDEMKAYFAEIGGILNDVKPHKIIVIGCDYSVTQTDEVTCLDEFEGLRVKGVKGGGGTRFSPVFDYITEHDLKPEALVYCTDLYGAFPDEAPAYPVIWAATSDQPVPWGDVVRLKT